ncbi:MAG: ABC transporter ATP-binding protein [Candidatus Lokiarchaeota archaeon]|nr:ABC transporter ATP-binding protein [Candidatus Lokiarchaeota archaeon]
MRYVGGSSLVKTKLKIENISKSFPNNGEKLEVLKSISIEVNEHEFLTIVGPSGCGKTTLVRIIAGLEKPDNGSIILNDKIIKGPTSKIGYVPQQFSLFPWRTVKDNIKLGLQLKGMKKEERNKKIEELLELIKLKDFKNFYPKDLSGGMKQKVAIARALAIDQELLLLDEPLISIDAQNRNKLQNDLIEIWHESKRTIIFVTHNIDEAVYLSDRIVVLSPLPAKIIEFISIPLERPRNRTSSEFNSIRQRILNLIQI